MSNFKVGDWVTHKNWDKFYEVIKISACSLCLRLTYEKSESTDVWYNITLGFIKKEETIKLEVGGKYRKVGTHEPVRVICTDRISSDVAKEFTCVSLVYCNKGFEYVSITTVEGKNPTGEVLFEEVPEVDWSNVPVDAPLWIKMEGSIQKRHFHKFEEGRVHYWPNGTTSFTCGLTSPYNSDVPDVCYLENPEV